MTSLDFICLSPLLIIAITPVIIMLGVTLARNFRLTYYFSLLMFIVAFLSLFLVMQHAPRHYNGILVVDGFGIVFLGIIYLAAIFVTIISYEYLKIQYGQREEYFILLYVSVLGASVIVLSEHFVTFFLGLEILSVPLYIMISYLKWRNYCVEAGVKFLIVASAATAFLLFGMGLVYAHSGTMSFKDIFPHGMEKLPPLLLLGMGLMLTGIGFKLALVPFHMWAPDVYQGAPMPVSIFVATVSKGALLALALRLSFDTGIANSKTLVTVLTIISVASMITGNLLALRQNSIKRLMAYSSIAHFGYLTIAILSVNGNGIVAASFYMLAYVLAATGVFAVLSALSVCEYDGDNITDLRGLFGRNPLAAATLSLSMLSLAGLPLTAGFISKFYVVLAGASSNHWFLVFSLVLTSLLSFYYYFRVIIIMFPGNETGRTIRLPWIMNVLFVMITAGILFLGLLPSVLTRFLSLFSSI
jgi:NADH-quinone oxidoreductase subunit N